MIVRDAAVQAVQAVEAVPREVFDAAKRAHDLNWGHIAQYDIGNDPSVDPVLPDQREKNYILMVAVILMEDVQGIVNLTGLPGNFQANVILAIMYYYRIKGWVEVREGFLQNVFEQM